MRDIELGIYGNCGFALSGKDIQEGEAEFVEILGEKPYSFNVKMFVMKKALFLLRKRLKMPDLRYYHGKSSPWGN